MKDFQIQAIGLMSGTSLDGLDVCCCTFRRQARKWSFHIDCAKGYSYPDAMKQILGTGAQTMSALEFITFHSSYGKFLGERVNEFMQEFGVHPDIIASHGHTIFHEPQKRIMYQIGDGAAIAAETHIPTVSDFRRLDIMLGGQGAPLVPIGDRLLFADYDFCLNIGGFSNISFEQDGRRIAFDISPVNYVINHYCRQIGLEFDRDGEIARQGNICQELLDELNGMDFYHQSGPKSLGREWVETLVYPHARALWLEYGKYATYLLRACRLANITHHHRPPLARWQWKAADYRWRCIQQVPHRTYRRLVSV